MNLNDYKTLVFDCDGVILNSNQTKVQAYYDVAKLNGGTDEQAQALAEHHIQKGSFPRNGKIEYYLREILHQDPTPELMQLYMDTFQTVLEKSLMQCEVAEGINALKLQTIGTKWMVLSGGDQEELRKLFVKRELAHLFELGIFGGPDIKEMVLQREIASGHLQLPALFIGDSKYDYQASTAAGLDFIFLSAWTEVEDWESFVRSHHIATAHNIASLLG